MPHDVDAAYSRFVWFDDDSASFGLDCVMLALASATNLGSGSCLSEGSFIAMQM